MKFMRKEVAKTLVNWVYEKVNKEFRFFYLIFVSENFFWSLNLVCLKLCEPWFKDFMALFSIKVDVFFFPEREKRSVFILLNLNEITKPTGYILEKVFS